MPAECAGLVLFPILLEVSFAHRFRTKEVLLLMLRLAEAPQDLRLNRSGCRELLFDWLHVNAASALA